MERNIRHDFTIDSADKILNYNTKSIGKIIPAHVVHEAIECTAIHTERLHVNI